MWLADAPIRSPVTALRAAHFDNSTNILGSRDLTKTVRYGRETFHEMMNGWVEYDLQRRDAESANE